MTTRLELRTALRRQLEDTGPTPLWDDATLNGMLAEAVQRLGMRVPAERAATIVVTAGATAIAPPADARRVVAVADPTGELLPRARSGAAAGGTAPEWSVWGGEIRLTRPAAAGTWRIDYLGERALPPDDVTAAELSPGEEAAVVALARAAALRRRAVEDAKRGTGRGGESVARLAEAAAVEAERLLALAAAGGRRARGGSLPAG